MKIPWSILMVILLAAGLRFWKLDLSQFHDPSDIQDWQRSGAVATGRQPARRGPDAAVGGGTDARLPGGLYDLLLSVAHRIDSRPISGLALTAVLGTVGVALTVFLARLFMPQGEASLAGLLAASAPVWVFASRRIWSPGIAPAFSAAFFLFLGLWCVRGSGTGLVLALAWAGMLMQLHPSGLALLPLLAIAVVTGLSRPKALLLGLALFAAPLSPFLIKDASQGWAGMTELVRATRQLVGPARGDGVPWPVSWPLPYLPPLSACAPGDDFLDRAAAAALVGDPRRPASSAVLEPYWNGAARTLLRSFHLKDLPAKVRLHRDAPLWMRVKFLADTAGSLGLLVLVVGGILGLVADGIAGDAKAWALLAMVAPMLAYTRIGAMRDSPHFYFAFFPLPAILAARAVTGMGRWWRAGRIALVAAALVSAVLVVDRTRELEALGGAPGYGVPHRYRVEAATWLAERGIGRDDVTVLGPQAPWAYLLPPGRGGRSVRVVELSERALRETCRVGPASCDQVWHAERRRGEGRLLHRRGGIWVYDALPPR